jgi:hypothetical protein
VEENQMKSLVYLLAVSIVMLVVFIGCDTSNILSPDPGDDNQMSQTTPLYRACPPPPGVVSIDALGQTLTLWPYIGADLLGDPHDPVNLIFIGEADPRDLRQALLSLDGDRTAYGMPAEFPFNCTWRDCMGDIQGAYAEPNGWVGNAIQMECGDYRIIRFHLRFFKAGDWTIGNCHFEFLIPGTTDHQVLSWELAEQFVTVDFLRSGLLDPDYPIIPAAGFNDSPWDEIPDYIYNELPVELRALIGGPLGDVGEPVPIWSDGNATILNLANGLEWVPDEDYQNITIQFDQVIPKPFCNGDEYQYVYVQGPIYLDQTVRFSDKGRYSSKFTARGTLAITPVDPSANPPTPIGETYLAEITQDQFAWLNHQTTFAKSFLSQVEIPDVGPYRGSLISEMQIGPYDNNHYSLEVECE